MKAAAFVSPAGEILGLKQLGIVRYYDNSGGLWAAYKETPLNITEAGDLPELQNMLKSLREDGCSIFVVREIGGVPGSILESVGFRIWLSQGNVMPELDYIQEEEKKAMEKREQPAPEPRLVGSACEARYSINLTETLKNNPHLNSREILIPFIRNTPYKILEIICDHTPKWVEKELGELKAALVSKTLDKKGLKLILVPTDKSGGCGTCSSAQNSHSCGSHGGCYE